MQKSKAARRPPNQYDGTEKFTCRSSAIPTARNSTDVLRTRRWTLAPWATTSEPSWRGRRSRRHLFAFSGVPIISQHVRRVAVVGDCFSIRGPRELPGYGKALGCVDGLVVRCVAVEFPKMDVAGISGLGRGFALGGIQSPT